MALQSIWMREHMLQSPTKKYGRKMSDSEMRVKRSIQKLSIPDWYVNNSSRPPKILTNYTPIDQRPPPWKNFPLKKSTVRSTNIVPTGNSTVSRNGVLETEIGPLSSVNETYKIYRIAPKNESLPSSRKQDQQPKIPDTDKIAPRSRHIPGSQTFPRISPSKKMDHINIVLPRPPKTTKCVMITDLDDTDSSIDDMSEDSLNATMSTEINVPLDVTWNYNDEIADVSLREKKILQTSKRQVAGMKIWEPSMERTTTKLETTTTYKFPDAENLEPVANSTPDETPIFHVSINNDRSGKSERQDQRRSLSSLFPVYSSPVNATYETKDREPKSESSSPKISSIPISDCKTIIPINEKLSAPINWPKKSSDLTKNEEKCKYCKTHESVDPRTENLEPPSILGKSSDPKLSLSCLSANDSADLSWISLLSSSKKSSELERIVKSNQQPRNRNSLVSEIIEELNEKCKISPVSKSHDLPQSKNYVKNLVMALENGDIGVTRKINENTVKKSYENFDNIDDENNDELYSEKDIFFDSENSSVNDVNSAALTTSISYSGTDTSRNDSNETNNETPSIKNDCEKYELSRKIDENNDQTVTLNNNNIEKMENKNYTVVKKITPIMENKDDYSIHWNKINQNNLPRTSSRLSITEKLTSLNNGQKPSCISPIDRTMNDPEKFFSSHRSKRFSTNGWGNTYRTNDRIYDKRTGRFSELTILDSGYSDKSSYRSFGSTYSDDTAMTAFDYTDTMKTVSEINSYYGELSRDLETSNISQTKAQIHGRSFII